MSQSLSPKGKKVFDYFVANPTANASKVAAKFKMSMSNVYKLKTSANSTTLAPEDDGTPGPSLEHEALLKADFAMRKAKQTPEQKAKRAAHYFPDPVSDVNATLDARAQMYGKFKDGAALMQAIKRTMAAHASKHDKTFADDQWEALEMIVHKMGRIVNGDPNVVDHWVDIAGYATLVADRLDGRVR